MTCCLSSADAVFLDDEDERQECVMTEMGIIYHGAYEDIAERNWNFGQVRDISEESRLIPLFLYIVYVFFSHLI